MTPKYSIGDKVWWAKSQTVTKSKECPDCQGTGQLTVLFPDESRVSIPCGRCGPGYHDPTGRVTYNQFVVAPVLAEISRVEIKREGIEYGTTTSYCVQENALFDTEEDAATKSTELFEEKNREEEARILRKHDSKRTWAFNARYHRQCIERAKHDIEYHTKKLNAANLKAKKTTGDKSND